jgi:hypothetical protein
MTTKRREMMRTNFSGLRLRQTLLLASIALWSHLALPQA